MLVSHLFLAPLPFALRAGETNVDGLGMKAEGWGLAGARGSQVGTVLLSQQLLEAPFHALLLLSRLAVGTSLPPDPP